MIWFYRDFLDGYVYVVVALLSVIFIMAIIGFIMERMQLAREEKNRTVVLEGTPVVAPLAVDVSTSTPNASTSSTVTSVIPDEVIQKSENAATNDAIPEVLDLNAIDANQKN